MMKTSIEVQNTDMDPAISFLEGGDRRDRLTQERLWHSDHGFRPRHLLNAWPFWDQSRNQYAWHLVERCLTPVLAELGCIRTSKVLVAPAGWGGDLPYILRLTRNVVGIDISLEALGRNDPAASRVNGDIIHLPFADGVFDFVVVSGFLHHVASEAGGYERYVVGVRRAVKPKGWIVVIEPSWFYPFFWITWPLRKVFGEITGQVSYERPINPLRVKGCLQRHGFEGIRVRAASYSHPRFFLPVARVLAAFQGYIEELPLLKYCGFFVLFTGQKS